MLRIRNLRALCFHLLVLFWFPPSTRQEEATIEFDESRSGANPEFRLNKDPALVAFHVWGDMEWPVWVHDPEECPIQSRSILQSQAYAPDQCKIMLVILEALQDSWLLDLGANMGMIAMSAGAYGFKAIAVEPMEYNAELLRASIALNGFPVTLVQSAVSNVSGTACMEVTDQRGNGNLNLHGATTCEDPVPIRTVDDILTEMGWPCIGVVKSDMEGFDIQALQGASRLLSPNGQCRPCLVQVEHIQAFQRRSKGFFSHVDLTQLMEGYGYTV
eukprot:1793512-Rhodomonas_salina.1